MMVPVNRAEGAEEVAEPPRWDHKGTDESKRHTKWNGWGYADTKFFVNDEGTWNLLAIGTVPSSTHTSHAVVSPMGRKDNECGFGISEFGARVLSDVASTNYKQTFPRDISDRNVTRNLY